MLGSDPRSSSILSPDLCSLASLTHHPLDSETGSDLGLWSFCACCELSRATVIAKLCLGGDTLSSSSEHWIRTTCPVPRVTVLDLAGLCGAASRARPPVRTAHGTGLQAKGTGPGLESPGCSSPPKGQSPRLPGTTAAQGPAQALRSTGIFLPHQQLQDQERLLPL